MAKPIHHLGAPNKKAVTARQKSAQDFTTHGVTIFFSARV
jgi:hypothetical protein